MSKISPLSVHESKEICMRQWNHTKSLSHFSKLLKGTMKLGFLFLNFFSYISGYVCIYPLMCRCLLKPKCGVRSHGVGVIGSCESSDVGAVNWTPASILDHWASFHPKPWLSFSINRWVLTKNYKVCKEFFFHFIQRQSLKIGGIPTIYPEFFPTIAKEAILNLKTMQYFSVAFPGFTRRWAHSH